MPHTARGAHLAGRGNNRVGPGHGVEPGKQRLFDVEPFDDGLDDDVGLGEDGGVAGEADAIEAGLPGVGCKSPLRHLRLDHLCDMRHCRLAASGFSAKARTRMPPWAATCMIPRPIEIGSLGIKGHGCLRQRRCAAG